MKHTNAPSTINAEAAALITIAQSKCEGCRLSWRLDKRRGWRHREPMPIECNAKEERKKLRDIANKIAERRPAVKAFKCNKEMQVLNENEIAEMKAQLHKGDLSVVYARRETGAYSGADYYYITLTPRKETT